MQKLGLIRITDGKEGEVENTIHVWDCKLKVPSASDNRSHPWDFKSSVLWDAIHDSVFITEKAATVYCDKDIWNEHMIGEWGSEAAPGFLVLERKPFAHQPPEAMQEFISSRNHLVDYQAVAIEFEGDHIALAQACRVPNALWDRRPTVCSNLGKFHLSYSPLLEAYGDLM